GADTPLEITHGHRQAGFHGELVTVEYESPPVPRPDQDPNFFESDAHAVPEPHQAASRAAKAPFTSLHQQPREPMRRTPDPIALLSAIDPVDLNKLHNMLTR
ncbi:hypothetical protein, partial [Streptomyces sp. NPDC058424]|uniref:hypothetical protein n=1 Tax=Streptomyces sp. NPDC058424 TaxID=3346491 RepID=UPI00364CFF3B